jgi:hypothetical protein
MALIIFQCVRITLQSHMQSIKQLTTHLSIYSLNCYYGYNEAQGDAFTLQTDAKRPASAF